MPRYCAVKVCRNRGGTTSKQDNKRISFYPFPLQDKHRLQKWVDNMKREKWTPSRHQYLCSEHFTEDCFDIRWGIRYLKNTAIPTIFPSAEDDGEKKGSTVKRSLIAKPSITDAELKEFVSPLSNRPLILSRTCKNVQSGTAKKNTVERGQMMIDVLDAASNTSDVQTAACEQTGDGGMPARPCLALSSCSEPQPTERADSTVTVLCCESPGPLSYKETNVDAAALQLMQGFSFVPVDLVTDESRLLEERGPGEGEHVSVYEHSYCRPDTDKDQLWCKILSLHAKILELDRREEMTVAKIHAVENEIALLKRDAAVFKEKQKVLEDYISSVLL